MVLAAATVVAFAAYTWTAPNLPANHAMVITVPLVVLGLVRYAVAASRSPERNADELLAHHRPLLLTVLAFAGTSFGILVLAA